MEGIILIYWNYVSLLRKAELHGVLVFNIFDFVEGGNKKIY
jgi:hypothetical protein